jgi:hypothetical protein
MRLGLLDSNQFPVGLLGSVSRLELDGRHVVEVAVQPLGVVPVDPPEGGELHVLNGLPWSLCGSPDELGLVGGVDLSVPKTPS